jgi:hypothetical protein
LRRFSCPSSWVAMVGRVCRSGGRSSSSDGSSSVSMSLRRRGREKQWSMVDHQSIPLALGKVKRLAPSLNRNRVLARAGLSSSSHKDVVHCSTLEGKVTTLTANANANATMVPVTGTPAAPHIHATPSSLPLIWRPAPPPVLSRLQGDSCRRGAANGLAATVP